MPADRRTEGFVLAIVAAVLWGFGPTATKLSLDGYAPEVVGIARLGTAALFFRMLGGRGTAWFPRERWGVLAGLGLGVDFVLYNYGVQRTTADQVGDQVHRGQREQHRGPDADRDQHHRHHADAGGRPPGGGHLRVLGDRDPEQTGPERRGQHQRREAQRRCRVPRTLHTLILP